ncbi:hypothetical protein EDB19DRAFT_1836875 [Suillus lakei]|nr:hypothetical protein EDB19DRAFT_1836875 [Suillus lakei]
MSSNNSKNSKSSEVLPLNDGALLECAPGMAFMPLEALDMVFAGWEGAEGGMTSRGGIIGCGLADVKVWAGGAVLWGMNLGFGMGGTVDVARVVGMIKVLGGISGSVGASGSNTGGLRVNVGWAVITGKGEFVRGGRFIVLSSNRDNSVVSWGDGGSVKKWICRGRRGGAEGVTRKISGSKIDQTDQTWGARVAREQFPHSGLQYLVVFTIKDEWLRVRSFLTDLEWEVHKCDSAIESESTWAVYTFKRVILIRNELKSMWNERDISEETGIVEGYGT